MTENRTWRQKKSRLFSSFGPLKSMIWIFMTVLAAVSLTGTVWMEHAGQNRMDSLEEKFGSWHAAVYNADAQRRQALSVHPVMDSAVLLNLTPPLLLDEVPAGTGAQWNPAFVSTAHLKLKEGRYPQQPGEVLITQSVTENTQRDLHAGDILPLHTAQKDWQDSLQVCGIVENYADSWIHYYSLPDLFVYEDSDLPVQNSVLLLQMKNSSPSVWEELRLDGSNTLKNVTVDAASPRDFNNIFRMMILAVLWLSVLFWGHWKLSLWVQDHESQLALLRSLGLDRRQLSRDLSRLMRMPFFCVCVFSAAAGLLLQVSWPGILLMLAMTGCGTLLLRWQLLYSYRSLPSRQKRQARKQTPVRRRRRKKSSGARQLAWQLQWARKRKMLLPAALCGLLAGGMLSCLVPMNPDPWIQNFRSRNPDLKITLQTGDADIEKILPDKIVQSWQDLSLLGRVESSQTGNIWIRWNGLQSAPLWNTLPTEQEAFLYASPARSERNGEAWLRCSAEFLDLSQGIGAELLENYPFDPETEFLINASSSETGLQDGDPVEICLGKEDSRVLRVRHIGWNALDQMSLNYLAPTFLELYLDRNLLPTPEGVNKIYVKAEPEETRNLLYEKAAAIETDPLVQVSDQQALDAADEKEEEKVRLGVLSAWVLFCALYGVLLLLSLFQWKKEESALSRQLFILGICPRQSHHLIQNLSWQRMVVFILGLLAGVPAGLVLLRVSRLSPVSLGEIGFILTRIASAGSMLAVTLAVILVPFGFSVMQPLRPLSGKSDRRQKQMQHPADSV